MPLSIETRPNDASSPRGDQTRQRLLQAAVDIFGRQSFDSTTTRQLADAAGVNLSAIPYYFGGKQGLYNAVAEEIAEYLEQHSRPLIGTVREILDRKSRPERAQLLDALHGFMADFTRVLVGDAVKPTQISFIIHEQLKPSSAFERIYGAAMQPLHMALGELVARLVGADSAQDQRAVLISHTLIGQALGFIVARSTLLRRLERQELDAEIRSRIVVTVADMSVASLTALAEN